MFLRFPRLWISLFLIKFVLSLRVRLACSSRCRIWITFCYWVFRALLWSVMISAWTSYSWTIACARYILISLFAFVNIAFSMMSRIWIIHTSIFTIGDSFGAVSTFSKTVYYCPWLISILIIISWTWSSSNGWSEIWSGATSFVFMMRSKMSSVGCKCS